MKKLFLAVLALTFCFTSVAVAGELTPGARSSVKQIQAADLFTTSDGERVKLIGVKIPASKKIAKEALEFMKREIAGQPVIIEAAGLNSNGRTLARAFVGNQSMQDMLLLHGYAIVDESTAGVSLSAWRKSESCAKMRNAGWWGEPKPQKSRKK